MELTLTSRWGGTLNLIDNAFFYLTNVDGMTQAATDLSSVVIGGYDGDVVTNVQAQPRSMIFDFRIKPGVNVEDAKRHILTFVKLKQKATVSWTQNSRAVTIEGIVDSIAMPRFNNAVVLQMELHCSQPFWEDLYTIVSEISSVVSEHYFTDDPADMLYFPEDGIVMGYYDFRRTATVINAGDVAAGAEIVVQALGTVTNFIIYNAAGQFFGVGYTGRDVVLNAGDLLVINTAVGKKSVTVNGVSVLDKVKPYSTWLQVEAGVNEFTIGSDDADTDNMMFTVEFRQRYV